METNATKIWQAVLGIIVLIIIAIILISAPKKETTSDLPATPEFGTLNTKYVTASEWPPKVQLLNGPFSCSPGVTTGDQASFTASEQINGEEYCVTKMSEGAAGSTYTTYAYSRKYGDQVQVFTFTLRTVQCGNYDEPTQTECKTEQANLNPNTLFGAKDVTQDPSVDAEQLCYIWNTEAGDKAQFSVDIRGTKVFGEFNWLPIEKDKKTGIFEGTISGTGNARTIDAWWETSAEGMTATEELKIKLGGTIAQVGFGEMKDRGDGTYVYANPSQISYAPNLQKTDCGDAAMD